MVFFAEKEKEVVEESDKWISLRDFIARECGGKTCGFAHYESERGEIEARTITNFLFTQGQSFYCRYLIFLLTGYLIVDECLILPAVIMG